MRTKRVQLHGKTPRFKPSLMSLGYSVFGALILLQKSFWNFWWDARVVKRLPPSFCLDAFTSCISWGRLSVLIFGHSALSLISSHLGPLHHIGHSAKWLVRTQTCCTQVGWILIGRYVLPMWGFPETLYLTDSIGHKCTKVLPSSLSVTDPPKDVVAVRVEAHIGHLYF